MKVKSFVVAVVVAVFGFLFLFLESKPLLLDLFRRIASVKIQSEK